MICQNCKKQINEESKTCPECGVIIAVEKPTNNVIIEQPVVNQVIEEEHKDKITKKDKKKILITISVIFFALSITTIIMAYFLPEKEADKLTVPIPTIKPQEKEDLKTIEYNGYSISYLPDNTATIENDLLILEGTDLYFSIKLYPGVTKENYNQNKDKLKLDLTNSGFKINDEEKTIRSGIEFDLLKFGEKKILSIELKSENVGFERIKIQLELNKRYLKYLGKPLKLYTFVMDEKAFYELTSDNKLVKVNKEKVINDIISLENEEEIDVDKLFHACEYLVSPINEVDKFLNNRYFLTTHQDFIKKTIFQNLNQKYFKISGEAGTGKTLLLYDLAKELSNKGKVRIISLDK